LLPAVAGIVVFGIFVYFGAIALPLATQDCDGLRRSVTFAPPGITCFGVKDGLQSYPWDSGYSSPVTVVPVFVVAALIGLASAGVVRRLQHAGD